MTRYVDQQHQDAPSVHSHAGIAQPFVEGRCAHPSFRAREILERFLRDDCSLEVARRLGGFDHQHLYLLASAGVAAKSNRGSRIALLSPSQLNHGKSFARWQAVEQD